MIILKNIIIIRPFLALILYSHLNIFLSDQNIILIRCQSNQLNGIYNTTQNTNGTTEMPDGLLDKNVIHNLTQRIEKSIQHIIPTNQKLTLKDNITVELIDNGYDSSNRTIVSFNLVISSTGNLS